MYRRLIYAYTAALSTLLTASSCRDIIEPSIAKRDMQLQAPSEGYISTSYNVNFWWNEVDDALRYRLQIVSRTFDTPDALVLDTLVKTNKYIFTLPPGQYQWHVRAENGSTQTPYSVARNLQIAFSSIKQQKVQLLLPTNNLVTNQSNLALSWGSLYGATHYRLQIDTGGFTDETKLVYNQTTPAQQLQFTLSKDQVYQWRIRAENDTAQSQWSAVNSFTYDHTPPARVTLGNPANRANVSLPLALNWSAPATAVRYKLYLLRSDSTTALSNNYPLSITGTSYSFNQGAQPGDQVYWRVTALDAAGNESQASVLRSFTLQY